MKHYSEKDTSVVILAAGRGRRMGSLTKNTPKPLLKVGNRTLIEHHLTRLCAQGFNQVVINLDYLGKEIQALLGNGQKYDVNISYSDESETGALETAGGLKQALSLIKSDPFLVINADIWTDFSFNTLLTPLHKSGRIVLVDNPNHNRDGDFTLTQNQLSNIVDTDSVRRVGNRCDSTERVTFSGIALYKKSMFENIPQGKGALGPILKSLIDANDLEGLKHSGAWTDVGTPERLLALDSAFTE